MTTEPQQRGWSGVETGWSVVSTLIAGLLTVGGLGYLLDRVLGTEDVFTGIGFVLGAVAGIYIVYVRYGKDQGGDS